MYERICDLIAQAREENMLHEDFLERLALALAEEVDDIKDEVEALRKELGYEQKRN